MNTYLVVRPTPDHVAEFARDWIVQRILESIEQRERCIIALSGGSTPRRLYQMLAELPLGKVDWSKVHLIWGDERNVPLDHPDSNFGMVRQVLLNPLGKSGPNVYPVPIDPDQPQKTAEYYEATLRSMLCTGGSSATWAAGRFPKIDVVLLGLGDDSHTASLFPHSPALEERQKWVVGHRVDKLSSYRITMTAPLLNAGREIMFLICGKGKQVALQNIWHGSRDPQLYPAQLIHPADGNLWWIVDRDAVENVAPPAGLSTVPAEIPSVETLGTSHKK